MASQVPEYRPREQIMVGGASPNFSGLTSVQASSSILAGIGSSMAQNASQAMAQTLGYQSGENPHGDLLPPITDFDKTYNAAYEAQSYANLSLQAQELYNQSQLELAKLPKLTPEAIQSFQDNMLQGFSDISSFAPTNVKRELENKFRGQMVASTGNLQMKLAHQQMMDDKADFKSYQSKSLESIYNFHRDGALGQAEDLYNQLLANNTKQYEAGRLSLTEKEASDKAAKLSHYGGYYSNLAIEAAKEGKQDEFLRSFYEHKPDFLSYTEQQSVGQLVLQSLKEREGYLADNETILYSDAISKITTGSMSAEDMAELKTKVRPALYSKVNAAFNKAYFKGQISGNKTQVLAQSLNIPEVVSRASTKEIDSAFAYQVNKVMQDSMTILGKPLDEEQAKIIVAGNSVVPISSLVREIGEGLTSPNPEFIQKAALKYSRLSEINPVAVSTLGKDKEARFHVYENFVAQGSLDPALDTIESLKHTKDSPDVVSMIMTQQTKAHKLNTYSGKVNFVRNHLIPIPSSVPSQQVAEMSGIAMNALNENLGLTNGNWDAAVKMTEKNLSYHYAKTDINGLNEMAYMPIEQVTKLGEQGLPLIYADMAEQVKQQVSLNNAMYNKGSVNTWYEVKSGVSPDEAMSAKKELEELSNNNRMDFFAEAVSGRGSDITKRYHELRKVVNEFEKTGVVKVVEHNRDGTSQEYSIYAKADSLLAQSTNPENPVAGDYIMRLYDAKTGIIKPMRLATNSMIPWVAYRPNIRKLQEQNAQYFNLPVDTRTWDEMVKEFKERNEQPQSGTVNWENVWRTQKI